MLIVHRNLLIARKKLLLAHGNLLFAHNNLLLTHRKLLLELKKLLPAHPTQQKPLSQTNHENQNVVANLSSWGRLAHTRCDDSLQAIQKNNGAYTVACCCLKITLQTYLPHIKLTLPIRWLLGPRTQRPLRLTARQQRKVPCGSCGAFASPGAQARK